MLRFFGFVFLSIFLSGCVTATRMNNLQLGMEENQVKSVMGSPTSTSAQGKQKYLNYLIDYQWYFVRLVGGKVEAYGHAGDFDSAKDPTLNVNVNKGK